MSKKAMRRSPTSRNERRAAITIKRVSVPMPDTGIGKEAGYADDQALMAAAAAERAALSPDVRAILDEISKAETNAFLFGEGGKRASDD